MLVIALKCNFYVEIVGGIWDGEFNFLFMMHKFYS